MWSHWGEEPGHCLWLFSVLKSTLRFMNHIEMISPVHCLVHCLISIASQCPKIYFGMQDMPQRHTKVSYSFQVDEMETTTMTSSESLSSNVIIQEIHCGEPSPLEVNNASGQILPENYQAAVPLVLSTDSNDQSSAMKSPRIPIPLSALSTIAQPNQVSFANEKLQVFPSSSF